MIFMDLTSEPFDLPQPIDAFIENKRPKKDGLTERLGLWELPLNVRGRACRTERSAERHGSRVASTFEEHVGRAHNAAKIRMDLIRG